MAGGFARGMGVWESGEGRFRIFVGLDGLIQTVSALKKTDAMLRSV